MTARRHEIAGRRVHPSGPDIPEPCQAVDDTTGRRCPNVAGHLFSDGGEIVAFCYLHREVVLANHPNYVPFDLFNGGHR